MKPFFSYMGSKYKLSSKDDFYPKPDGRVCEPFAGSACYSVRHDVKQAILIDSNLMIVDLWRFLISASAADIESIPSDLTNDIFVNLTGPKKYLVQMWLSRGRGSVSRSQNKLPGWYGKYKNKACNMWGSLAKKRIISQLPKIREWQVVHGDYSDAEKYEHDTIFIDPPYFYSAGKIYKGGAIIKENYVNWVKGLNKNSLKIVCENSKSNSGIIAGDLSDHVFKKIRFWNSISQTETYEFAYIKGGL